MPLKITFSLIDETQLEFFVDNETVIVGRSKDCQISIPHEGFSRHHAKLEFIAGEIFITDLGSTNGVMIDGVRIPPNQREGFQSFLHLQIGPAAVMIENAAVSDAKEPQSSLVSAGTVSQDDQTVRLQRSTLRPPIKPRKKKQSSGHYLVLAILVIAAGVIYQMNFAKPLSVTTAPEQKPAKVEPEKIYPIAPIITVAEASKNLASLNCSDEVVHWCSDAILKTEVHEGALKRDHTIYLYMNLTHDLEKYAEDVKELSTTDKIQLFMVNRIVNSFLQTAISQSKDINNIQIIGFTEQNNQPQIDTILKLNRNSKFYNPQKLKELYLEIFRDKKIDEVSKLRTFFDE